MIWRPHPSRWNPTSSQACTDVAGHIAWSPRLLLPHSESVIECHRQSASSSVLSMRRHICTPPSGASSRPGQRHPGSSAFTAIRICASSRKSLAISRAACKYRLRSKETIASANPGVVILLSDAKFNPRHISWYQEFITDDYPCLSPEWWLPSQKQRKVVTPCCCALHSIADTVQLWTHPSCTVPPARFRILAESGDLHCLFARFKFLLHGILLLVTNALVSTHQRSKRFICRQETTDVQAQDKSPSKASPYPLWLRTVKIA